MNADEEQNMFRQVTFFIPKTQLRFACILDGNVFDHVRTTRGFQNNKL